MKSVWTYLGTRGGLQNNSFMGNSASDEISTGIMNSRLNTKWHKFREEIHRFFFEEFHSDWEKKTSRLWNEWGK